MNDLTAIVIAIVSHLGWPACVFSIVWILRKPLASLLGRVESADSKYVKIKLHGRDSYDHLSRAVGVADAIPLPPVLILKSKPADDSEIEASIRVVIRRASKQPMAALSSAWDLLNDELGAMLERKSGRRPQLSEILPESAKILDQRVMSILWALMLIVENQRADSSSSVGKDFVLRFTTLINRIIVYLHSKQEAIDTKGTEPVAQPGTFG